MPGCNVAPSTSCFAGMRSRARKRKPPRLVAGLEINVRDTGSLRCIQPPCEAAHRFRKLISSQRGNFTIEQAGVSNSGRDRAKSGRGAHRAGAGVGKG